MTVYFGDPKECISCGAKCRTALAYFDDDPLCYSCHADEHE